METIVTEVETEAPPVVETKEAKEKEPRRPKATEPKPEAKSDAEPRAPREASIKVEPMGMSPEMRETARVNDRTIKEMIDGFGGAGCFKIRITRKDPDEIQDASGKYVHCGGFLKEVETEIDEEWISRKFGGGKYELEFKKPGPKGGWAYGGFKTVTIAGEPNLAELPRSVKQQAVPLPGQPGAAGENPSIVKDVLGFMGKQVEHAQQQANQRGPDDAMVQLLREQLNESNRKFDSLQKELRDMRDQQYRTPPKSTEDTVKDRMLDKLIDGDSARITALRAQYDSEIRALNEARREDERRMHDRFERDLANARESAKRELDNMRVSHEVALQAVRASTDVQVSSAKASYDTQTLLARAENDRLRAENSEMRVELKELRAKKDKSPIELLKDVQALKDAIGADGDDEPQGVGAQIAAAVANPATWEGVGSIVGQFRGQQQQAQQPAAQPAPTRQRRVVKYQGRKMMLEADGRTLTDIKETPPPAAPGEIQLPQIDPTVLSSMIALLESAFDGGQEPLVVAQGARSRVPEDLLLAIRDHGVDVVMTKMAKLPSTSPLSSQRGRVWVRALGEALVG